MDGRGDGSAGRRSIQGGMPAGPLSLMIEVANWKPGTDLPYRAVPTRWTSNYRGRRDLGMVDPECAHGLRESCPKGLSMGEHRHEAEHCAREGNPHLGPCVDPGAPLTPRQRHREFNAAFQAAHLERRKYGLRKRHAAKLKYFRGTQ